MQKIVLSVMAAVVLSAGGWFGYQQYEAHQAREAEKARRIAAEVQKRAAQAAAEAAAKAARLDIDAALKPMKVTSILPGKPGLAIIDKTEYAEGDSLSLPSGKRLTIAAIKEAGILLAYNGLQFHLAPPREPDLAAMRKR